MVPHDAVLRTKLLAEMRARLPGIDDRKVIEAMGSTSDRSFVIWESATTVPNTSTSNNERRNAI
jgi:hypothetical protein